MNAEQAAGIIAMVAGHWPNPAMTAEEVSCWNLALDGMDLPDALDALDAMSTSGRQWRPNDGEFVATYRRLRTREASWPRPALEERPVTMERAAWWIDQCHKIAAGEQSEPDHAAWDGFVMPEGFGRRTVAERLAAMVGRPK